MQEYTNVDELNTHIKTNLEQNFQYIKVSGELSNVKISNKNLFASLRDTNSSINICFWGFSNKFHKPINNGDQVNIIGKLVVYNKNGTYSINISKLELSDTSKKQDSIYTKYEETKKKYELLGYFNNKLHHERYYYHF
jgi:exodeoxyribonuclease VII large subunit